MNGVCSSRTSLKSQPLAQYWSSTLSNMLLTWKGMYLICSLKVDSSKFLRFLYVIFTGFGGGTWCFVKHQTIWCQSLYPHYTLIGFLNLLAFLTKIESTKVPSGFLKHIGYIHWFCLFSPNSQVILILIIWTLISWYDTHSPEILKYWRKRFVCYLLCCKTEIGIQMPIAYF